jgi:hypothetical protein
LERQAIPLQHLLQLAELRLEGVFPVKPQQPLQVLDGRVQSALLVVR